MGCDETVTLEPAEQRVDRALTDGREAPLAQPPRHLVSVRGLVDDHGKEAEVEDPAKHLAAPALTCHAPHGSGLCLAAQGRSYVRVELAGQLDERLRRLRAISVPVPGEDECARRDPRAEREHLHGAVAGVDDEARLDRSAEILGDEGAERPVVVGAEDHVQLGDAAGEEPLGLVGRAAADQRQLRDLAQRRRRVELRQLRAGGDEQDVRVLQHLSPFERPFAQRQVGEGQVELAVLEQAQEIGGGALLPHADADERPLRAEAPHEGGEEAGADALVDPHAKRSRSARRESGHVGTGRVEARDDRIGVAEQQEPGLRRLHAPRAARAVEELLPHDPLELRDLLADGRLRIAELARGAAEGAGACDRFQSGKVTQIDAQPFISTHDRYER